jgi:hypothetical protein
MTNPLPITDPFVNENCTRKWSLVEMRIVDEYHQ